MTSQISQDLNIFRSMKSDLYVIKIPDGDGCLKQMSRKLHNIIKIKKIEIYKVIKNVFCCSTYFIRS